MDEIRKVSLPNEILFERIKELVAEGHHVTFRVKGNSMNPFLIDGRDEVIVSPFKREDILPGIVILAKDHTDRVILHRVVEVRGTEIIMMGDGNCLGTETTDPGRVAGVITEIVRNGKRISCQSRSWKTVSAAWTILKPVRRWALAFWRKIARKI